jgi:hypothetical protein
MPRTGVGFGPSGLAKCSGDLAACQPHGARGLWYDLAQLRHVIEPAREATSFSVRPLLTWFIRSCTNTHFHADVGPTEISKKLEKHLIQSGASPFIHRTRRKKQLSINP